MRPQNSLCAHYFRVYKKSLCNQITLSLSVSVSVFGRSKSVQFTAHANDTNTINSGPAVCLSAQCAVAFCRIRADLYCMGYIKKRPSVLHKAYKVFPKQLPQPFNRLACPPLAPDLRCSS